MEHLKRILIKFHQELEDTFENGTGIDKSTAKHLKLVLDHIKVYKKFHAPQYKKIHTSYEVKVSSRKEAVDWVAKIIKNVNEFLGINICLEPEDQEIAKLKPENTPSTELLKSVFEVHINYTLQEEHIETILKKAASLFENEVLSVGLSQKNLSDHPKKKL